MTTSITSVHYPGAGWDDSFLYLREFRDVPRFVLYDILPDQTHYCTCHPATEKSDTPEHFLQTLQDTFGPPKRSMRNRILFERDGKTIDYHCRTDCGVVDVARDPKAAVYLRGLLPIHVFTRQPIYNACDSRRFYEANPKLRKKRRLPSPRIITVHVNEKHQSCFCNRKRLLKTRKRNNNNN